VIYELYERFNCKESEADAISAITLRPLVYIREDINESREVQLVEIPFSRKGVACEIEIAFLQHCRGIALTDFSMARIPWLKNYIV